jgi:hypothetical protein
MGSRRVLKVAKLHDGVTLRSEAELGDEIKSGMSVAVCGENITRPSYSGSTIGTPRGLLRLSFGLLGEGISEDLHSLMPGVMNRNGQGEESSQS